MILFYVWVIYPLLKTTILAKKNFLGWHFDIAFIPIIFAFNLFVEFLFPVAIAALQSKKDSLISKFGKANINMRKRMF